MTNGRKVITSIANDVYIISELISAIHRVCSNEAVYKGLFEQL